MSATVAAPAPTIVPVAMFDYVRATRAAYDLAAPDYAASIGTELTGATETPFDLATLGAFAELVAAGPKSLVLDAGCGPGRAAAWLARRDVDVAGIDVSVAMAALANESHPNIGFGAGALSALPVGSGSLAGVVCWYSIIHTPPDEFPVVAAELARVLTPGGRLLLAFQAGVGESTHRNEVYGHAASLTSYRHDIEFTSDVLAAAGLAVSAIATRDPERGHERSPQAFLQAYRPVSDRATSSAGRACRR